MEKEFASNKLVRIIGGFLDTRSNQEDFALTPYLVSIIAKGEIFRVYGIGICWGYYSFYLGLAFNLPTNYPAFSIISKKRYQQKTRIMSIEKGIISFDWETYTKNPGKYVVMTKHGLPVTQVILFDAKAERYPMRAVCNNSIFMYKANGTAAGDSICDLMMYELEGGQNE